MNRTHSQGTVQTDPANRPAADLPSVQPQEDSTYETVDVGGDYDKTTKFARSIDGEEGPSGVQHTYHVLEGETVDGDEPDPVYAKVDKSKKKSKQQDTKRQLSVI